jgi:hypothetical protein
LAFFGLLRMVSIVRWVVLIAATCYLSACSTFTPYPEELFSAKDASTFNCYTRYYFVFMGGCKFQAIDGKRTKVSEMFSTTAKIPPGSHWLELAFESYFGGGGGVTDVCAFDYDTKGGYSYQVMAHSLRTDIGHLAKHGRLGFYGGGVDIEVSSPLGKREVQRVSVTCSFSGGSMCRKQADCVEHPDIRCVPQEGFSFGKCGFRD